MRLDLRRRRRLCHCPLRASSNAVGPIASGRRQNFVIVSPAHGIEKSHVDFYIRVSRVRVSIIFYVGSKIRRVSTVRHGGVSNLKWVADYDAARPDPNTALPLGHNSFYQIKNAATFLTATLMM